MLHIQELAVLPQNRCGETIKHGPQLDLPAFTLPAANKTRTVRQEKYLFMVLPDGLDRYWRVSEAEESSCTISKGEDFSHTDLYKQKCCYMKVKTKFP
jgi:hypothetical protein